MICNQLKVIKYKNFKVKVRKMSLKQAKLENAYGLYIPQKSSIDIQQNPTLINVIKNCTTQ